jgi:organic radical activating enzyme
MKPKFKTLKRKNITEAISAYDVVVVSGGEPLLDVNQEDTTNIVKLAKHLRKQVVVYSNLSHYPDKELISLVDGWTLGFHDEETEFLSFVSSYWKLKTDGARSVRINVNQDSSNIIALCSMTDHEDVHPYELDDCDRSTIEDIYLLEESK